MLGVEQQPVEPRVAHDVGRDVAAQTAPQADLKLACRDGALEAVMGEFHHFLRLERISIN